MRDERVYPDAETFRPERFLPLVEQANGNYQRSLDDVSGGDPTSLVYGFGRRQVHTHRLSLPFLNEFSWIQDLPWALSRRRKHLDGYLEPTCCVRRPPHA